MHVPNALRKIASNTVRKDANNKIGSRYISSNALAKLLELAIP